VRPLALATVLLCACTPGGGGVEPVRRSIAEHSQWQRVQAAADPWHDEAEAAGGCDESAYREEPPFFEIDTTLCKHVTFVQPLAEAVGAGELVKVTGWHLPLVAPEPAEGHMALRLEGLSLVDYRVAIPARESVIDGLVQAEGGAPAGARLYLHVHNHGANSWKLLEVAAGPEGAF
jgi:hypothetical protein